jgi:hypothetical protein
MRCPECNTNFPAEIVKSTGSGGVLESDLCYRAGGLFVYPFMVVVCPGCRFASYHQEFVFLGEYPRYSQYHPIQRALGEFLRAQRRLYPGSERYRLAALSMQRKNADVLQRAHLYLRGSWCARKEGDAAAERYHQERAVRGFREVFRQEAGGAGAAIAAYLVGELCRRLGWFGEAEAAFACVNFSVLPVWLQKGFIEMRERARRGDNTPQMLPGD